VSAVCSQSASRTIVKPRNDVIQKYNNLKTLKPNNKHLIQKYNTDLWQTDVRTDGQTDDCIYRARIVSRVKMPQKDIYRLTKQIRQLRCSKLVKLGSKLLELGVMWYLGCGQGLKQLAMSNERPRSGRPQTNQLKLRTATSPCKHHFISASSLNRQCNNATGVQITRQTLRNRLQRPFLMVHRPAAGQTLQPRHRQPRL